VSSLSIGLVSFFAPFAVVGLLCLYALDWSRRQAEIGGLALSTTSLAVVYAVLVETGLIRELVGKRLMSATFVTDIATVVGLTVLFIKPTFWIAPFAIVSVALILALPKLSPWFFSRYGDRVIEPEIKLVFASLFLLTWLGRAPTLRPPSPPSCLASSCRPTTSSIGRSKIGCAWSPSHS
jgi:Kef-type K+ transport system membrane component KefB